MTRLKIGLLSCGALLLAGSITATAGEKKAMAGLDPTEKVNAPASGTTVSNGALQNTITAALAEQSPNGRSITLMSPVNATRFSLVEKDGLKAISLVDAKTNAVIGQWTIDGTTSDDTIAEIAGTVSMRMGLSAAPNLSSHPDDPKVQSAH